MYLENEELGSGVQRLLQHHVVTLCSKPHSSRLEVRKLKSMQGHTAAVFVTMVVLFHDHDWPGVYGDACCRPGCPVHVHAVSPRRSAVVHCLVWQALTPNSFAKGRCQATKKQGTRRDASNRRES
jgi:hypothetical protein